MICNACGEMIPDTALACPSYLRRQYLCALEECEINLMPHLITNAMPLKLLYTGPEYPYKSGAKNYHLGFHEQITQEAYCHQDLRSPKTTNCPFRNRPKNICGACAAALDKFAGKPASL